MESAEPFDILMEFTIRRELLQKQEGRQGLEMGISEGQQGMGLGKKIKELSLDRRGISLVAKIKVKRTGKTIMV